MMRRLLKPEILWPGFVVVLLLLGMGSAFAALYFAQSDGGAAVLQNYYREGVAWDSVAASRSHFDRAGWTATIEIPAPEPGGRARTVFIALRDSAGQPVRGVDADLAVYTPDRSAPVDRIALEPAADDRLGAETVVLVPGLWDFEVVGSHEGQPFSHRIRRELY